MTQSFQETVLSQVRHTALWGSRFIPGLAHALGPLWPVILLAYLAGVLGALSLARERMLHTWAVAAAAAGASYLVFPTGATAIQQGITLFSVNLRYATPALAVAILLIPIVVSVQFPRLLHFVTAGCLVCELAGQFEHAVLPSQTARHALFIAATAAVVLALWRWRGRDRPRAAALTAAPLLLLLCVAAAYVVQHHYLARRYLLGVRGDPGLGAIYKWAQPISHARIALYGTVEFYPLTGATVTNRVDYLGEHTQSGGYIPIPTCQLWRQTINNDHAKYIVLTPGPTKALPPSWSTTDPAVSLILNPAPGEDVFRIHGPLHPDDCA
jgi:hypothetical protein